MHGPRSLAASHLALPALFLGALGAIACSTGCGGGGGGSGKSQLVGSGAQTGASTPTGPSTPAGPTFGAPLSPVVYTLMTTDNTGRTPLTEGISSFSVDAAGAVAQLPDNTTTAGSGHQIFTGSGFALSFDHRYLFVGHNSSHGVEAFRLRTDGSLVAAPGGPVTVSQAAVIVAHPTLPVVYATRTSPSSSTSMVDFLPFDPGSGALTMRGLLPVGDSVRGIAVDPAGRFLATAHMFGAAIGVTVYPLSATDGAPRSAYADRKALPTSGRPSRVTFDRTGSRLYVGDLDRGIYAFVVGSTGALTALNGGTPYAAGGFCSDLDASPAHDLLFALTAFTSEIRPFRIEASGTLTALTPLALGDDCQHLAVSNGGLSIYATSRASSALRAYAVNPSTGAVVERAGSPCAAVNTAGVTGSVIVAD